MIPFPIISKYGNSAPIPEIGIKRMNATQQGNAQYLQYSNGDLYATGTNTSGRFGTGNSGDTLTAWQLINSDVRLYSASQTKTILIMNNGTVLGSGHLLSIYDESTGTAIPVSTTFVDVSSRYSSFNIAGIKQIVQYDTQVRQYLIDENNQLWGMGVQTSYVLGNNQNNGNRTDWIQIPNGNNCQEIQCTAQGLWIKKLDGTWWRCGVNSGGCLVSGATTDSFPTLTQFTDYTNLVDLTATSSCLMLRLSDRTMRFYGAQYWVNSISPTLTPYTPSVSDVGIMNITESYVNNFMTATSTSLMMEGANGSGALGLGNTLNAYQGTWYNAITGVIADPSNPALDYSKIGYMCSANAAGFFAYNNEIYVSGSAGYSQNGAATNGFWQVQRTPRSKIWAVADNNPAFTGTVVTNLSSATPVMHRYGHASAVWGNKLIVQGGLLSTSAFADNGEINIYDTDAGTWSTIENTTGINRYAHAMCVVGNLAYIWGGYTNAGGTSNTNTMYSVNLNTGVWTNLAPTNNVTFGAYARMASTSDGMVYMWGRDLGSQLYQYNPSTNTFVVKTSSSFTSSGSSPATVSIANASTAGFYSDGTYLYTCTGIQQMAKYDPVSNTWIQMPNKPNAGLGKCAYYNGVLYCIISNTLYYYRTSTGVWTTAASGMMAAPRTVTSMEVVNGAIYFIGGQSTTSANSFYKIQ